MVFEKLYTHTLLLKILVFLIPVLLYLNTLQNEYTLDDFIVITENQFVQKGFRGIKEIFTNDTFTGFFKQKKDLVSGGRYRPLSLATFAVEEGLGIANPAFRHLLNAVIYGLVCLFFYIFLQHLFVYFEEPLPVIPVALIATILFAFHPIHTEVVANIKGRDELLTALFGMLTLVFTLKYFMKRNTGSLIAIAIFFFLALLSKENAIAVLPLAIVPAFMRQSKDSSSWKSPLLALSIIAVLYLLFRQRYAGGFEASASPELMNNPFYNAGSKRLPTILFTLLLYLKLLFIPHPLTFDYYPYHIALHEWNDPLVIVSLLIHVALLFFALRYIRRQKILSFAILFYLITLFPASNLLINIGSFMNERFLFLPSAGFALSAGWFLVVFRPKLKNRLVLRIAEYTFILILLIFAVKTVTRNRVWKNNRTLFLTDVGTSTGSAKGNCMAGGVLYESARETAHEITRRELLDQSVAYLEQAVKIYPDYVDALLLLGNAVHLRDTNYERSLAYYTQIFELQPGYDLAFRNLNSILTTASDPKIRLDGFGKILLYRPNDFEANYQLGITYGKLLNDVTNAKVYLEHALKIRPENKNVNRDLGVAYAMSSEFDKSIELFKKVILMDPDDPTNYINLGISYQNTGRPELAGEMFARADSLRSILPSQ